MGDNYGGVIDAGDGGFDGGRLRGQRWRMTMMVTPMTGGVFQWRRRWTTARRWDQKEMQQSNRLQRRLQGEVKGIGGAHLGVGGMLSCL